MSRHTMENDRSRGQIMRRRRRYHKYDLQPVATAVAIVLGAICGLLLGYLVLQVVDLPQIIITLPR
jgi:ribose/xylose/arabinose/galactoside ABC-type transport system permease subunit